MALGTRRFTHLPGGSSGCSGPIIRTGDDIETGRWRRVANAPKLDLDRKKRELFSRIRIQPIYGGSMVRLYGLSNPNYCFCAFDARQIGEELTEVRMIRTAKLIFNEDPVLSLIEIAFQDVGAE
jgi:hypothetical protein